MARHHYTMPGKLIAWGMKREMMIFMCALCPYRTCKKDVMPSQKCGMTYMNKNSRPTPPRSKLQLKTISCLPDFPSYFTEAPQYRTASQPHRPHRYLFYQNPSLENKHFSKKSLYWGRLAVNRGFCPLCHAADLSSHSTTVHYKILIHAHLI